MTLSEARRELLSTLANRITHIERPHPIRVAVNGIDAAGKTFFSEELALFARQYNRQVVRASIDGFHNPRALRYQRGSDSPEGFYFDSFDNAMFVETLLRPLGPGGTRQYRTQIFDHRTDTKVTTEPQVALRSAILIADGIFLLRPELNSHWDYRIYLDVSFDVALRRALQRDRKDGGAEGELIARYHRRYIPGQQIYIKQCKPETLADAVIDNNDLQEPVLTLLR